MDIRQLRYFIAIAEQGTISKAAEHLHMAQPPLSRQLKMMEDELGVVLFDRNKKKKVTLTSQGELFLKKAKKLLHGMEEAILEVKEFSEEISGTLSVGSTIYCASILLSNLKEFRQKYSHIKFNIWEGDSTHLMNLLKNRQIDIALLLLRPTEGTGLFDQIINVFQKLNLTPNILCECHDSAMLLNLVEMGFGATILPLSMINQKLMKEFKIISIQDNPWISEPALVWRANSYLSASTREFLRLFNN